MLRFLKFFAALLIAALFAGFAVANRDIVSLKLFPFSYELRLPQFLLTLIAFALGAVIGRMLLGFAPMRMKRLIRLERQRIEALEHELALLRMKKQADVPAIPANQP